MPDPRFAIIDPAAGISGDMLLGALVGVGLSEDWLRALPKSLGFTDVTVDVRRVDRAGLAAVKVDVRLPDGGSEAPAQEYRHSHDLPAGRHHSDHAHSHDRPPVHGLHRHVGELLELVDRAAFSPWVRERAHKAFELLGEAEGRVHGVSAAEVALHEVGAVDAVIDIVGVIAGFEQLGVGRIYSWPAALGSGWVTAAHGTIPVPAPVTAILMEGLTVGPNGPVSGEATTPTGAVLLRVLSEGSPPPAWRPVGTGWGAGGRNPGGYSNVLRLLLAEGAAEAAQVVMLATDVDDLSPEYIEPMREGVTAAGALDIQVWATQMKKGRVGFRIEALATPDTADAVTAALFRHTTTAGVRRWPAERATLARRSVEVQTREGIPVRVKLLDGPDGVRAKPEFDDVAAAARAANRPAHEIARELQARALELVSIKEQS